MTYDPETWVDDVTEVTAARMNHIEQGIKTVDDGLAGYRHIQGSPNTVWTIVHNLDRTRPEVVTVDGDDNVVYGDVAYISDSTVTVTFAVNTSGEAFLI